MTENLQEQVELELARIAELEGENTRLKGNQP